MDFFFQLHWQMFKDINILTKAKSDWFMLCLTAYMKRLYYLIMMHNVFPLREPTSYCRVFRATHMQKVKSHFHGLG